MKDGITTAVNIAKPRKSPVTTCNGVFVEIQSTLFSLRAGGASYDDIANRYNVNKAQVYRALNGDWSDAVACAVTKRNWHTVPTRVLLPPGVQPPAELVIELRQCPVSDTWFVPTCEQQRFAPGMSEAAKRMARHDLDKARERYAKFGDWGKR